jgi:hypothetical protein
VTPGFHSKIDSCPIGGTFPLLFGFRLRISCNVFRDMRRWILPSGLLHSLRTCPLSTTSFSIHHVPVFLSSDTVSSQQLNSTYAGIHVLFCASSRYFLFLWRKDTQQYVLIKCLYSPIKMTDHTAHQTKYGFG